MQLTVATAWVIGVLLLSMRLMPTFAFAPPFTLLNIPLRIRVLIPIGLAVCLIQLPGALAQPFAPDFGSLIPLAASELLIGIGIAFALQAAFAALYFAGRILDFQAGFALALVIDPATRTQTPLLGTVFALAAAAIFFAVDGHHDLLRAVSATLEAVPVGAIAGGWSPAAVIAQFSLIFAFGVVVAGAGMLVLFLTDVTLAFLMRTMPQMNVLLLGLQVKTIVLFLTLLLLSGLLVPNFLRLFESAFRFIGALER